MKFKGKLNEVELTLKEDFLLITIKFARFRSLSKILLFFFKNVYLKR